MTILDFTTVPVPVLNVQIVVFKWKMLIVYYRIREIPDGNEFQMRLKVTAMMKTIQSWTMFFCPAWKGTGT